MLDGFVQFSPADFFYNWEAVLVAFFVLAFSMYHFLLTKTVLGRGDNKGVGVVIALILALLTVYGVALEGFGVPLIDLPGLGLLSRFPIISDYLGQLGIFGLFIIAGFLFVLYELGKGFAKFFRGNVGI